MLSLGIDDRLVVVGEEVTPGQLMLPYVVVDLGHQLVVVLDEGSRRKRQPPVRPVGQRNVLQEVLCDRADPVSRNLVIGERLPADRVDQLRRSRRKVASTLRFGWNELNKSFRRAVDARPLVGSEVEELALDNRAAQTATGLIPLQRVFLGCEELARVHRHRPGGSGTPSRGLGSYPT